MAARLASGDHGSFERHPRRDAPSGYAPGIEIHVLPDAPTLAGHAASLIADYLLPGRNLALAGGSTPAATYRALSARSPSWEGVHVWLGDERWVPPDHEESNTRMALNSFGDAIAAALLRIPWSEDASPDEVAAAYEHLLRTHLGDGDLPQPGLVLLGIGDDCHTASLFPHTAALDITDRSFVANWVPAKETWRLTATLPMLHRAEKILFLVQGAGKAAALRDIIHGDGSSPAALVARGATDVTWLVDDAASHLLEPGGLTRP